jgi:hypothetical protein
MIRRREFIAGIGSAVAWPVAAWAQQSGPMRRIGVLLNSRESDEDMQLRLAAFEQSLGKLGWIDGRNIRIDYRGVAADIDRVRTLASELVALRPDVLLANGSPVVAALQRATREIPIVFTTVIDPIGSGFVASLARPGGNITGFMSVEAPLRSKWVELLKGIAPAPQAERKAAKAQLSGSRALRIPAIRCSILVGRIGNRDRRESFINEVLRAQRQAGAEPGSNTGRRGGPGGGRSTFGRGRTAFSRSRLFATDRRVVVKARVVRHQRRGFRSAPLSAHVAYLERDGVTRDGEKDRVFGATEDRTDPWPSRDAASTTVIISGSSSRRRMPPR